MNIKLKGSKERISSEVKLKSFWLWSVAWLEKPFECEPTEIGNELREKCIERGITNRLKNEFGVAEYSLYDPPKPLCKEPVFIPQEGRERVRVVSGEIPFNSTTAEFRVRINACPKEDARGQHRPKITVCIHVDYKRLSKNPDYVGEDVLEVMMNITHAIDITHKAQGIIYEKLLSEYGLLSQPAHYVCSSVDKCDENFMRIIKSMKEGCSVGPQLRNQFFDVIYFLYLNPKLPRDIYKIAGEIEKYNWWVARPWWDERLKDKQIGIVSDYSGTQINSIVCDKQKEFIENLLTHQLNTT